MKRTSLYPSIGAKPSLCSSVKNGHRSRRSKMERRKEGRKEEKEKERKKEEITAKGKSANPVRRSHYRLDFDCSGSASTGATRYTLYSASVRFLEIHSEEESTRTQTRNSIRNSIRRTIRLFECTHSCTRRVWFHPWKERRGRKRRRRRKSRQGMSVDL